MTDEKLFVCTLVCLCVNQGAQITVCTDLLMNSDYKTKLGQSDLVYWVSR